MRRHHDSIRFVSRFDTVLQVVSFFLSSSRCVLQFTCGNLPLLEKTLPTLEIVGSCVAAFDPAECKDVQCLHSMPYSRPIHYRLDGPCSTQGQPPQCCIDAGWCRTIWSVNAARAVSACRVRTCGIEAALRNLIAGSCCIAQPHGQSRAAVTAGA